MGGFNPNRSGIARLRAALLAGGAGAVVAARRILRMAVEQWRTDIVRVVPVEFGRLRASFQTRMDESGTVITAAVGSNVDYGLYLELGTERIAGGAVAAWRLGDPVIADWPAKQKSGAAREQMPYLRPTGAALKPQILAALGKGASKALRDNLHGKKF